MRHGWRLAALWALILAAWSNSFEAGLVFDNATLIAGDARIQAATALNIHRIFAEPYWPNHLSTGLYRPLTTLSYLANYAVFGDGTRPEGYHWVNLALHLVNVTLVYALGLAVFESALPGWALAGIWGLHPLLTESVTNIVGRADLLAAMGVLAGLLCYARGSAAKGRAQPAWLCATAAAQAIGLFSKENAAILPGLMLLFDLLGPRRILRWSARLPFYAALLLPFAGFFFLRAQMHEPMIVGAGENSLVAAGFVTARLTAVKVIGKWPLLFLWPARLSADYSYNAVPLADWADAGAIAALLFCAASAAAVIRWGRARQPFAFFLAFFFVALVPTSNLVVPIGSIMAERFAYLPAIGLAGCAAAAIQAVGARRAVWAAAAAAVILLGARTYARNFDWNDELSLWTSAVAACPESFKAHASLANALSEVPARLPEAVAEYQAALRIKPDFAEGHLNLGNALSRLGRRQEAIAEYQEAVRLDPQTAEAHYSLAIALEQDPDRFSEAIPELQVALRLKPDLAAAHGALGNALAGTPGRMLDAIAEYQAALRLDPGLAEAHFGLGAALAQIPGRVPEAIPQFQAALRLRPDFWEAHYNLGRAFLETRRLTESIAEYQAALQFHPDPRIQQLIDRLRSRKPLDDSKQRQ